LNRKYYALKIIPKYQLNTKGRLYNLFNEPYILKRLNNKNNFVPQIISSFQDYENLYLVTTFYDGPSLEGFLNNNISEYQIKFISACIILALKYIRKNKIIHRDLTITNVIMDKDNYFNLIDFSFSIDYSKRHSLGLKCNINNITTPPEIFNNLVYDYNSDYYNFGFIIFFMIFKKYPSNYKYYNLTKLREEYKLNGVYSNLFFEFLEKLIVINITKRIGYNNIEELVNHPWFNNFNWDKLEHKKIISPLAYNKTKIAMKKCLQFNKTKQMILRYKKFREQNTYRKLLKSYDFSTSMFQIK